MSDCGCCGRPCIGDWCMACRAHPPTMVRCDRKAEHKGPHSWERTYTEIEMRELLRRAYDKGWFAARSGVLDTTNMRMGSWLEEILRDHARPTSEATGEERKP